ncbi:acyl-CoA dehydrogenase family protein [Nocardia sp. NBC_01503]|uniref:acyl-CoA dehydrogenase family protein n=1 Tax=Nocardia sp. NBC_01503 TaxID=2975997 RepID=UPI002E7C55A4|nr:acyl-CoA dehydrogenase family protein [Nocardia sp. NBC_01503]WTL34887.1 acyl-CoA dehydrogenase family protein [Nocardia sp. NBC_01503]
MTGPGPAEPLSALAATPRQLDFAAALDAAFDEKMQLLADEAESARVFPREVVEILGDRGVLGMKWDTAQQDSPQSHTDLYYLLAFAERLGRLGSAGVAAGMSLHDSSIAILRRFGRSEYLRRVAQDAIAGRTLLCIGATENGGGSDLQGAVSTAVAERGGYRLVGHKKFLSLSPVADVAILVVRVPGATVGGSGLSDLALFAVPIDRLELGPVYAKVGAHGFVTAPITVDTWLPAEHLIARPGTGMAALTWGISHERLSIAGQVLGACDSALGLTVARMKRREQFGTPLFAHQALRLRIADLDARVGVLRWALRGLALSGARLDARTAAAMKVTAARLGSEVLSECMHIFGGTGYLTEQSPLGQWWCDMKLARVGGGTDEVLWELVAAGLVPDYDSYDRLVHE